MDSELVQSGTIEVLYSIWEYTVDGEPRYDWELDSGETSGSLFLTVHEAESDLKSRY